jgi:hypothetical protein
MKKYGIIFAVLVAGGACAQIMPPMVIDPPTLTKVSVPQAPNCVELNLVKGSFVVLDQNAGWTILTPPSAQPGYCTADQVFISEYGPIFGGGPRQRGPIQCPAEHFVAARMGEFICGFVRRQAQAVTSLADRIDTLSNRLDNVEKKTK